VATICCHTHLKQTRALVLLRFAPSRLVLWPMPITSSSAKGGGAFGARIRVRTLFGMDSALTVEFIDLHQRADTLTLLKLQGAGRKEQPALASVAPSCCQRRGRVVEAGRLRQWQPQEPVGRQRLPD
jgi:hypothetical protein